MPALRSRRRSSGQSHSSGSRLAAAQRRCSRDPAGTYFIDMGFHFGNNLHGFQFLHDFFSGHKAVHTIVMESVLIEASVFIQNIDYLKVMLIT